MWPEGWLAGTANLTQQNQPFDVDADLVVERATTAGVATAASLEEVVASDAQQVKNQPAVVASVSVAEHTLATG
jgi:hypothetical protein